MKIASQVMSIGYGRIFGNPFLLPVKFPFFLGVRDRYKFGRFESKHRATLEVDITLISFYGEGLITVLLKNSKF